MSDDSKSTRRDVIKTLGGGAFLPVGELTLQQTETVKLPDLVNNQGVVKWAEVPKPWEAQMRRTERVYDRLKQRFANNRGVVEICMTASQERFGGKRGQQVKIGLDKSELTAEIPDHVDGIPVQTVERPDPPEPLACKNRAYDELPGSGHIRVKDSDGDPTMGTTGWKVEVDGDPRMLTATHVVEDSADGDVLGDQVMNLSFQTVAQVETTNSPDTIDVATLSSDRTIRNEIDHNGTVYPIKGWVHEDGITSRSADPVDGFRKFGATTGLTKGGIGDHHIGEMYYNGNGPTFEGHGVRGSADAAPGDSGAAAISLHDGGDAYITHMINQGDTKFGLKTGDTYHCHKDVHPYRKSIGIAAYYLHNEYNYEVQGSKHV